MNKNQLLVLLVLMTVSTLLLAACSPTDQPSAEEGHNEEGHEDEHSPDDHVSGHDYIPPDAAEIPNPYEATEDSIGLGADLYAKMCAICHGENGEGDGPGGEGLEKKPANLHDAHVQSLTDGSLFYVISHGKPDTPMLAWENVLEPEERWHVVNFVLSLED